MVDERYPAVRLTTKRDTRSWRGRLACRLHDQHPGRRCRRRRTDRAGRSLERIEQIAVCAAGYIAETTSVTMPQTAWPQVAISSAFATS